VLELLEREIHRQIKSTAGRRPKWFVIARCAKRAAAIQLDCFVAALLAMTGGRKTI
jgi:hypothetical protein